MSAAAVPNGEHAHGFSVGPPPAEPRPVDPSADSGELQQNGFTFSLIIEKSVGTDRGSLGIDVTYSSEAAWPRHGIFIARIFEDGLVAAWNTTSTEPRRVQKGDFIYQVNDIQGDTVAMIREMKFKSTLIIHILRRAVSQEGHDNGGDSTSVNDVGQTVAIDSGVSVAAALGGAGLSGIADGEDVNCSVGIDGDVVIDSKLQEVSLRGSTDSTAEELMPQLEALSDEALAGLVCVALTRRPWLRTSVLAAYECSNGTADSTEDDRPPAVRAASSSEADVAVVSTAIADRSTPNEHHTTDRSSNDTEPSAG